MTMNTGDFMTTVMIHAEGTDCDHPGEPVSLMTGDARPCCPAGQEVTHVRFASTVLKVEDACAICLQLAESWTAHLTPQVTALAAFAQTVMEPTQAIRALAAAAAVVDGERAREEISQ